MSALAFELGDLVVACACPACGSVFEAEACWAGMPCVRCTRAGVQVSDLEPDAVRAAALGAARQVDEERGRLEARASGLPEGELA